jgi:virginiamycin B lyase
MNEFIEGNGTGDGAVIYVHGGGFAHTMPEAERALARRLSDATGRPVLRVDYRLAPAHPYPAALEDVLAAWRSVLARGVPAARVAFFGESAGATLVLSALLEIARTGGPGPGAAIVVSPLTDLALTGASLTANDGEDVIDRTVLTSVIAQYLAGAAATEAPQSPFHGDLRGLPPLLVAVGGDEVLLDDARRFARAARDAGVSVGLHVHEGMKHAFHLSEEDGAALFEEVGRMLRDPAPGLGAGPVREFTVSDADAGPCTLAAPKDPRKELA